MKHWMQISMMLYHKRRYRCSFDVFVHPSIWKLCWQEELWWGQIITVMPEWAALLYCSSFIDHTGLLASLVCADATLSLYHGAFLSSIIVSSWTLLSAKVPERTRKYLSKGKETHTCILTCTLYYLWRCRTGCSSLPTNFSQKLAALPPADELNSLKCKASHHIKGLLWSSVNLLVATVHGHRGVYSISKCIYSNIRC